MRKYKRIFLGWLFLFVLWLFYRYLFSFPSPLEEFIIKPVVWLGFVFLIVILVEKRPLSSLGLSANNFYRNVYLGLGLGTLFAFEGILVNYLKYGRISFLNPTTNTGEFFLLMTVSLAAGFTEEVVSRGYFMSRLWEISRSEFVANITSSLLFTALHLPVAIFGLHYSPYDLIIYLWIILLLGLADGYVYARTKTIVAPTIIHAMWNLSIILFR
jgi:membrane protease YdiL (CAAX protease family)